MPGPGHPHMSPEPEHRRTRRVPISYQVKLVSEDQLITYASAINLSLGGMLLQGGTRLPIGSQCGVAILIADGGMGQRIVTRGTVVRDDAQGLAIAFSKALDPSNEDSLRALLQSLAQPPEAEPSFGQPSTTPIPAEGSGETQ